MATHLYWRLNVSANNGSANLSVAELGLYVALGTSSAATGGTPTASTVNGSQTADKGFDASTSTYWQATTSTGWLKYQFASAVDIAVYTVAARNDSNQPTQAPKAWTLEWSDDGSAWTTVDTVTKQNQWGQGETRYYTVGANAGATASGHGVAVVQPARQATPPTASVVRYEWRSGGADKSVSGTVKELGVAISGKEVRVYDAASGLPLDRTVSAVDGTYSLKAGGYPAVFVVAFDPTDYQMLGYDRVTPG